MQCRRGMAADAGRAAPLHTVWMMCDVGCTRKRARTLALEACAAGSLEVRRRQSWNIQQALFWMKCCCKVDWMYVVVCGLLGGGGGEGDGGPFVCVSE